ncbi:Phage protein (N4 Gp49/phage Sf6 gene 66) family [uncultured Caudovirales phage]|uniref:Phage protein (N4 Gp49/phage Sf6 gene 66) family n=1 Tax=uncultured Caudovirales phage TaxID=2100421 RepID=A0A6J5N284_9CAUD|nr:Phage protein (N4 Gp49/phage Sf6 gene 66) family [uncultured Caudovirales phage]
MSDNEIETMIQEKRLNAPRVTPTRIREVVKDAKFFRLTRTLTVCVLELENGFTVTGESACASPENFNEEIGNKIARENAESKVWALEGYLLRDQLFRSPS